MLIRMHQIPDSAPPVHMNLRISLTVSFNNQQSSADPDAYSYVFFGVGVLPDGTISGVGTERYRIIITPKVSVTLKYASFVNPLGPQPSDPSPMVAGPAGPDGCPTAHDEVEYERPEIDTMTGAVRCVHLKTTLGITRAYMLNFWVTHHDFSVVPICIDPKIINRAAF